MAEKKVLTQNKQKAPKPTLDELEAAADAVAAGAAQECRDRQADAEDVGTGLEPDPTMLAYVVKVKTDAYYKALADNGYKVKKLQPALPLKPEHLALIPKVPMAAKEEKTAADTKPKAPKMWEGPGKNESGAPDRHRPDSVRGRVLQLFRLPVEESLTMQQMAELLVKEWAGRTVNGEELTLDKAKRHVNNRVQSFPRLYGIQVGRDAQGRLNVAFEGKADLPEDPAKKAEKEAKAKEREEAKAKKAEEKAAKAKVKAEEKARTKAEKEAKKAEEKAAKEAAAKAEAEADTKNEETGASA